MTPATIVYLLFFMVIGATSDGTPAWVLAEEPKQINIEDCLTLARENNSSPKATYFYVCAPILGDENI